MLEAVASTPNIVCVALTAGDRVDLKKRIAKTLGKQNASDVDLTLNEFGFNTFSDWEGDLEGYVAAVLRYADDDEAMAQVDAYLHPTETPEPSLSPRCSMIRRTRGAVKACDYS